MVSGLAQRAEIKLRGAERSVALCKSILFCRANSRAELSITLAKNPCIAVVKAQFDLLCQENYYMKVYIQS